MQELTQSKCTEAGALACLMADVAMHDHAKMNSVRKTLFMRLLYRVPSACPFLAFLGHGRSLSRQHCSAEVMVPI